MTELRALTRERELRGYSKMRKAELMAFLQDNENQTSQQPPSQSAQTPPTAGVPHSAQNVNKRNP